VAVFALFVSLATWCRYQPREFLAGAFKRSVTIDQLNVAFMFPESRVRSALLRALGRTEVRTCHHWYTAHTHCRPLRVERGWACSRCTTLL